MKSVNKIRRKGIALRQSEKLRLFGKFKILLYKETNILICGKYGENTKGDKPMKKTKRFTAILLAAVLLGGCGSENNTNTLEYRSEESNDTKSEYVDSEEISEKLDEVKDILGEEYRFDENNYILCQATNEEEKEEVSVNIYCDDKYEIGATCFNLAIPKFCIMGLVDR